MGDEGELLKYFNIRVYNAYISYYLHLNPNELDDLEWGMRAGEAYYMMCLHAPNRSADEK